MTAEPRDVEAIRSDLVRFAYSPPAPLLNEPKAAMRLIRDVEPLLDRLAAADRENAKLRGEVERLEADRDAQTQWPDDDGWLRDQHARYHDQSGNMLGRTDCGEVRCDFWDAAVWVLNAPGGIRGARAQLAAAQAQLAEARAWLAVVRDWPSCGESTGIASNRCMLPPGHIGAHDCQLVPGSFAYFAALSAAPQPEPEEGPR